MRRADGTALARWPQRLQWPEPTIDPGKSIDAPIDASMARLAHMSSSAICSVICTTANKLPAVLCGAKSMYAFWYHTLQVACRCEKYRYR